MLYVHRVLHCTYSQGLHEGALLQAHVVRQLVAVVSSVHIVPDYHIRVLLLPIERRSYIDGD
jgi:hypothetical protein